MPKNLNHPPIYFDLSLVCGDGRLLTHSVELHFSLSGENCRRMANADTNYLNKHYVFWLIKIKCMRIGLIISKHDADDPKIGRNRHFSGVTDDVEHTIFGRKIRNSGRFLRPKRP